MSLTSSPCQYIAVLSSSPITSQYDEGTRSLFNELQMWGFRIFQQSMLLSPAFNPYLNLHRPVRSQQSAPPIPRTFSD